VSVKYTAFVMPVATAMSFRPSPADVVRLVDHLRESAWIRSPQSVPERSHYLDPAGISAHVATIDPTAPYSLWFAGAPETPVNTSNDASSEGWLEGDDVFRPHYCEDVKIVCGTRLATPSGEGVRIVCPHCGDDLRAQMVAAVEAVWSLEEVPADLKFIDWESLYPAPDRCAACSNLLNLATVVAEPGDEGPFAAFMIRFMALTGPPSGTAQMPADLMHSLAKILGVEFRSVGRYW
jgi:hypothetical protein